MRENHEKDVKRIQHLIVEANWPFELQKNFSLIPFAKFGSLPLNVLGFCIGKKGEKGKQEILENVK